MAFSHWREEAEEGFRWQGFWMFRRTDGVDIDAIVMAGDMHVGEKDGPKASGKQQDGTADVAVVESHTAEQLASQEKAIQTEKGKEMAVEVTSEKSTFDVGSHVACLSTWDNPPTWHSAEVVDRRDTKRGVEYYVHYRDYNKRLDAWVPSTHVKKWSSEILPPLKDVMAEKLPPLFIPTTPAGAGPGSADPQRNTPGAIDRKLTRNLKRRYDETYNVPKPVEELTPLDRTLEKEHEEKTKVKNIQVVELGKYEISTWYYSPYPEEYAHEHKLYICEFCLKYLKQKKSFVRHKKKCELKRPPGDEIYKTKSLTKEQVIPAEAPVLDNPLTTSGSGGTSNVQNLSVFEVDGRKSKMYCQNLCLLAKLFLDHKTLYYDVDSFLFYILTEDDDYGSHLVGYFSKEKCSAEDYNVACILTLPPFQRKGYGRFLISFAYELSKKEGKVGTPERPLSDLGQVSFRSYWTRVLLEVLHEQHTNVSIKDLTSKTSIRSEDIIDSLTILGLIKYYKGTWVISVNAKVIDEHIKSRKVEPNWSIDATKIQWSPAATPAVRRP